MKNKYILIVFLTFLLLFNGCTEKSDMNKTSFSSWGKEYLQNNLNEFLKVDAKCIYPPECRSGIGMETTLGEIWLWDKRDDLASVFLKDKLVEDEIKDYGLQKEKRYYTENREERFAVSTEGYLDYKKVEQYTYITNVLYDDERFDSYNADVYSQKENHDFLSKEDAWKEIQRFFNSIDIEVSDDYSCYVMDYTVMQKEETSAYQQLQEQGEKTFSKIEKWTEKDNCYYFKTYTVWNGYPVIPVYTGEGIDEKNVVIIYDQSGIIAVQIDGYYPLEAKQEVLLRNPDEVVNAVEDFLGNIISDNTYELQELRLCQKVVGLDAKKKVAEIVLVWECKLFVKNKAMQGGYMQNLYFDAQTLEQL